MVATADRLRLEDLKLKHMNAVFSDTPGASLGGFLKALYLDTRGGNPGHPAGHLGGYFKALNAAFPALKAATGLSISVDPDGGVLVPPGIADQVWRAAVSDGQGVLGRLRHRSVSGISYEQPTWSEKSNSRATGSRNGGLRFYDVEEGEAVTASTPKLRSSQGRLKKMVCQVALTNELLEDSPDLAGELNRIVAEELNTALTDRLINEAAVGRGLSLLKSPSLVTVTKETSQAAGSLVAANIAKAIGRLYCKLRPDGVVLVNPELEKTLGSLSQSAAEASAAKLVQYIDPVTKPGMPFALINGLPGFLTEECRAPGTVGDLIVFAPSTIQLIVKSALPDFRASMHVKFDMDEQKFQWTLRYDFFSLWNSPLTPLYGSDQVSNIIAIETRS